MFTWQELGVKFACGISVYFVARYYLRGLRSQEGCIRPIRDTPITRINSVRVRTRARQAVFVYCLHSFTRMPQVIVAQGVRCEGFSSFKFTAAIDGITVEGIGDLCLIY